MNTQEKLAELNRALSIVDGLLMDAELDSDVRIYSTLHKKINNVYMAILEEYTSKDEDDSEEA